MKTLESCIQHHRERWGIPGVVVGIYRDGELSILADGIGHLRAEWPMRPDNLFRIASISKVFTATVAMMLVDEGQLDLDEPVIAYVPDLELEDAEASRSVTMRHLLSHTGGMFGDFFDDFGSDDDALAREVAHLKTVRQLTGPGELWHYNNAGFDLAGHVIASITGQLYEDVIRERIFQPLGMERAGFFADEMITWPHAVGHDPVEPLRAEHRSTSQHFARNNNPSGAILTNAEELLRFAALHLNDGVFKGRRLISAESAQAMRQPQVESGDFADYWGIGWNIVDYNNSTVYGHGGSTCGFQSQLTIYPEAKFALCIWTNSGQGRLAINPIEAWILEQELGLKKSRLQSIELSDNELQRLVGHYTQPMAVLDVEVAEGGLVLNGRSKSIQFDQEIELPETRAMPIDRDRFAVLDGPFAGEIINFFPRGSETPTFLRRHGRLFERVG
jgi:CubicO group peptidase (beta-lactamase class C family)